MAIKFQAYTTSAGAAPAALNSMIDAIKALALTHANWTLVEDVVLGTSNFRWVVLKCAAASSGLPNDIFVVLVTNQSSSINVYSGEAYTTATHTLSLCTVSPSGTTTQLAIGADGRLATHPSLSPSATGSVTVAGTQAPLGTSQSGAVLNVNTLYWFAGFYDDHCVLSVCTANQAPTAGTNGFNCYIGGYTSLVPNAAANDPSRLVHQEYGLNLNPEYPMGSFSREVGQFWGTSKYGAYTSPHFVKLYGTGDDVEYGRGSYNASKTADTIQGYFPASRVYCMTACGMPISGDSRFFNGTYGLRGLMKDMLRVPGGGNIAGIAYGDTIAYNGTQWLFLGRGCYTFIDTGIAA